MIEIPTDSIIISNDYNYGHDYAYKFRTPSQRENIDLYCVYILCICKVLVVYILVVWTPPMLRTTFRNYVLTIGKYVRNDLGNLTYIITI